MICTKKTTTNFFFNGRENYGLFCSSCHHKETETEIDDLFIYEVISNSNSDNIKTIILV